MNKSKPKESGTKMNNNKIIEQIDTQIKENSAAIKNLQKEIRALQLARNALKPAKPAKKPVVKTYIEKKPGEGIKNRYIASDDQNSVTL